MKRTSIFAWLLALGMLIGAPAGASSQRGRWVRVVDGYRLHQRYVVREHDGSQYVLGEFYEVEPGSFVAQCYPGNTLAFFSTLVASRDYVLGCR